MRVLFLIMLIAFSFRAKSQESIFGEYHQYDGYTLKINPDSTFDQEFHFDTQYDWVKGKWSVSRDTIFLTAVWVIDTSKYYVDGVPVAISFQDTSRVISKLYYHKQKLYFIKKSGEIMTRKEIGIWPIKRRFFGYKKFSSWFIKRKENNSIK